MGELKIATHVLKENTDTDKCKYCHNFAWVSTKTAGTGAPPPPNHTRLRVFQDKPFNSLILMVYN